MESNERGSIVLGSVTAICVVFFWSGWIVMLTVTFGILLALGIIGFHQQIGDCRQMSAMDFRIAPVPSEATWIASLTLPWI